MVEDVRVLVLSIWNKTSTVEKWDTSQKQGMELAECGKLGANAILRQWESWKSSSLWSERESHREKYRGFSLPSLL